MREHEIWKAAYAAATQEERNCCEAYKTRTTKRVNCVHWGKCARVPAPVPTLDEYLAMRDAQEKESDSELRTNGPRHSPTLSESYNDLTLWSSEDEQFSSDDSLPTPMPPLVPAPEKDLELPAAFSTDEISSTQPATQYKRDLDAARVKHASRVKSVLKKSLRLAKKKRAKVNALKTSIQRLDKKCEALRATLKAIEGYEKAL
jgi:hypothetical protein